MMDGECALLKSKSESAMFTKTQRILLQNVVDALDRLYDNDSGVIDVYAMLYATWHALSETPLAPAFEPPIHALEAILQSGEIPDRKRTAALGATDQLRHPVCNALKADAQQNPKQRHNPR